ncbi:MAG: biotin/lipoyl-containing protein [Planctomycetaceae bacterium]
MPVPVVVPELGAGKQPVRLGGWLVQPGETVDIGDRLVELLVEGVTFDLPAPASGVFAAAEHSANAAVRTGDVIGWISGPAQAQ